MLKSLWPAGSPCMVIREEYVVTLAPTQNGCLITCIIILMTGAGDDGDAHYAPSSNLKITTETDNITPNHTPNHDMQ